MKNKENNSNEGVSNQSNGNDSINNEKTEELTGDNFKAMLNDLYKKVDSRVKNISNEIKTNLIPKTEKKLKQNIFSTVLIALGIGFILGVFVMLFGFLNGKKR